MRQHGRNLSLCLLALSLQAAETPTLALRQGLVEQVQTLDKASLKPDWSPTLRDVTNAALVKLATGAPPSEAEALLKWAFATQDMDRQSPTYGIVPWQVHHDEIQDANAIEFALQALGPILKHYRKQLSPAFRKDLQPHLVAALACIHRHEVPVSYTNIFLMKTVNLILLGEAVQDSAATAEGYQQLDDWIAYTRDAGIHEYGSPTYYATDLGSLLMGYLYAEAPGARARFKAILDMFWTDIAAHTFAPRQDLAGAHSRDYDFLQGEGGLLLYMQVAGLRDHPPQGKADLEKVFLLESQLNGGYQPAPSILKLATLPERWVTSRWDLKERRTRSTFLTPGFALGSANGDYGPQDKLISLELASNKGLPVISVFPETDDAPYGKQKTRDKSGHAKPHHLPARPQIVQERGALLAWLDLNPNREGSITTLATHVILPANADELRLDGHVLETSTPFSKSLGPTSVIGLREGGTVAVLRVFQPEGCGGCAPEVALKADPEGLALGALRLTITHYRGPAATLPEKHVRVGLLLLVGQDLKALTRTASKAVLEGDETHARATLEGQTLDTQKPKVVGPGLNLNQTCVRLGD